MGQDGGRQVPLAKNDKKGPGGGKKIEKSLLTHRLILDHTGRGRESSTGNGAGPRSYGDVHTGGKGPGKTKPRLQGVGGHKGRGIHKKKDLGAHGLTKLGGGVVLPRRKEKTKGAGGEKDDM